MFTIWSLFIVALNQTIPCDAFLRHMNPWFMGSVDLFYYIPMNNTSVGSIQSLSKSERVLFDLFDVTEMTIK